jgi:hypothetical protein
MREFGGGGDRAAGLIHFIQGNTRQASERQGLFWVKEKYGFLQKLKPLNFAEKIKKEMFEFEGRAAGER